MLDGDAHERAGRAGAGAEAGYLEVPLAFRHVANGNHEAARTLVGQA